MKSVILAGNAVTAEILYAYLQQDSRYKVVATVVDDAFVASASVAEVPALALSNLRATFAATNVSVIMASGYNDLNRVRESMFTRIKGAGFAIETYVHPDARVYSKRTLGEGCIVLPGAVIEPNVQIGANTLVWCNTTLAHHCAVADHCWIASGAVISGKATISRNTFVGVNATVVNNITVGEYNVIGGGALITKDTKANTVHLARTAELWRYTAEDYAKYFGV